jgi:hypothetical protein
VGSNVTVYIKGLVFSYPVRCAGSKWSIVQGGLAVIISGQRCVGLYIRPCVLLPCVLRWGKVEHRARSVAVIISGQRCDDSMQGLVFSYPVRCAGGKWNIVQYLDSIRPGVL